jgi:uncharacterized RDD family membrane protein YckC
VSAPDPKASQVASLPARFGAWIYEGIILFGLVWFADYAFDALTQSKHALMLRHARMVFLFVLLGVYFVYFWRQGQTLPMKTWKIRLRNNKSNRAGQAATWGQCALRYVLSWLWFLPPLTLLYFVPRPSSTFAILALLLPVAWVLFYLLLTRFLPQGQYLHDVLAGTVLERYAPEKPHRGLV